MPESGPPLEFTIFTTFVLGRESYSYDYFPSTNNKFLADFEKFRWKLRFFFRKSSLKNGARRVSREFVFEIEIAYSLSFWKFRPRRGILLFADVKYEIISARYRSRQSTVDVEIEIETDSRVYSYVFIGAKFRDRKRVREIAEYFLPFRR